MNYIEAVDYIHSLLKFGIRPGLSGMNALLHLLDNPHKALKFVHVAGTNGKGSTSTAVSSVLIDAGYDVGLYTSPYVCEFLERVQFNGKPVDKTLFSECVCKVKNAVEKLENDGVIITEFEALTASAFLCFKALSCHIVVLEVGLGGRLDATNVIDTPVVNIITSLSLDHTAILGNTIEEIAFEKCGTLKGNGNVVVSFGQPENALRIIKETVNKNDCKLVIPDENLVEISKKSLFGTEFTYKNEEYKITMPGLHQVKNMTCVIEACCILRKQFTISQENIKNGILKTVVPARVEVLCKRPLIVLDGGHNEDGAKAFFEAIQSVLDDGKKVYVLAGMMADKAVESSLKPLFSRCSEIICVTPDNPRAMPAEDLSTIAKKYCSKVEAIDDAKLGVDYVMNKIQKDDIFFLVGSLYLAGEVRGKVVENLKKFN